jgi:hypothetical protein
VAAAEADPAFGGFYFDQKAGGIPTFVFAEPEPAAADDIRAMLPPGAALTIEIRPHAYAELRATADTIIEDLETWNSEHLEIMSVAVDVRTNSVLVGVQDLDGAISSEVARRYGLSVRFRQQSPAEADACTSISACWPPKGGFKIVASSDGGICTSAFVARRTDTDELTLVTAGHCLYVHGGSDVQWTHNGSTIGKSKQYIWESFKAADVGLIRISDASTTAMASNFRRFISNANVSPPTVSSLEDVASNSLQQVGYSVCRTGWASHRTCGEILYRQMANYSCVTGYTCRLINGTYEVDFDSTGGDSGGSMFSPLGPLGYGLHVHSDPDDDPDPHGWYTTLQNARDTLIDERGVTVNWCTTSLC